MKKAIFFIIATALCLTAFGGCASDTVEVDTQGEFCRVLCLKEDGIVVEIPDMDLGYVYVKLTNTDLEIDPLDTVVMEFAESDLEPASGKFTDYFGEELRYSYILENPKNIRHTTEEEPTFG